MKSSLKAEFWRDLSSMYASTPSFQAKVIKIYFFKGKTTKPQSEDIKHVAKEANSIIIINHEQAVL